MNKNGKNINFPYANSMEIKRKNVFYKGFKRFADIFCSGLALLIFTAIPVLPVLTAVTAIMMRGNPFFLQWRPGKNCRAFRLIKFRTMTNCKDNDGKLLPDEDRLTGFGRFLRNTSLDELPELLNIFFGQMSIVGPRPQLTKDMVFFSSDALKRQSVRPGLTGYAQTNGRNNVTWEEKFDLDIEYLDKRSFFLDLGIIFKTILKVLKKDDIATDGMDTAEDYGQYLLRIGAITEDEFFNKLAEASMIEDKYGI